MTNIHSSRPVAVVIDMQNDFISPGGFASQHGWLDDRLDEVTQRVESFLARWRAAGNRVIFIRTILDDEHLSDAMIARNARIGAAARRCRSGTWGAELALPVKEDDLVIDKHRYDAFFGTDLDVILRGMAPGLVALCGVYTDVCVEATAMSAYCLNYHVALVEDCCAAVDDSRQAAGVERFHENYGIVRTSDELIAMEQPHDDLGNGERQVV